MSVVDFQCHCTHETTAPGSKPRAAFAARDFCSMAAVLLAVRFLLSIRDVGGPPSPISVVSAEIERSITTSPRYLSKPIRDIQPIADCVLADNPETPGQAPSYFGEFDRESRRIVRLEVPKPDGSTLHIAMLRSEEWLRNQIGFVVAENSDPSGERLGVSPPSEVQEPFPAESGQPNKENLEKGVRSL
jgi:hypothetical protein